MSVLPNRIVVLVILCCIFFLTNQVQCRRFYSSKTPKNPTVTTSKEAVRLVDGDGCSGRLQVKSSGSWHYVCSRTFSVENSFVTCREFECGFPRENYGYSLALREEDSWSPVFNCSGQEQQLSDCPVAPLDSDRHCRLTFLGCSEQPIFPWINGYSQEGFDSDGEMEVYAGHSYVIICKIDSPFKVDSFVLQFNTSEWIQPAEDNEAHFFLPFQPSIWNNHFSFTCQYNFEMKPENFSSPCFGSVSFKEPSYARLVGGESRCLGSLELKHRGEWRPVSQQHWGLKEAAVVCRQLHCGSVISSDTQSRELQPVWRFFSDCDGSERALLACGGAREGNSISTVNVLCSDILQPANISVESMKNSSAVDAMVVYSLYSFYINCSVLPQFPGGHFSLVFTGVKHSLTMNQTAANHSAVFTFASAEKAHSGNYTCIYHNTAYGHNFSSQSQKITIVVEDAEDVQLDNGVTRDVASTVCAGTLLVKDSSQTMMVTAETRHWDMKHASIVCRQLGCGSALSTSTTQIPKVTPMWRFFSDCSGSEAALLQCGHVQKWFSSTAIKVVCES